MLRTVDAHVFGTILNAVPTKGAGGYRYGYGYKSEDVPAEAAAART